MRVLSVGHMTFSSDHRYHVVQVPRLRLEADDWNLEVMLASDVLIRFSPGLQLSLSLIRSRQ